MVYNDPTKQNVKTRKPIERYKGRDYDVLFEPQFNAYIKKKSSNYGLQPTKFSRAYLNKNKGQSWEFIVKSDLLHPRGGFPGKRCPEEQKIILDLLKLKVPTVSRDWVMGFWESDGSIRFSMNKEKPEKGMTCSMSVANNRQRFHLLVRTNHFFENNGSIGVEHPHFNSSCFGYLVNSLHKMYDTNLPLLNSRHTGTLCYEKRLKLSFITEQMEKWKSRKRSMLMKDLYVQLVDEYTNLFKKSLRRRDTREPVVPHFDWIGGFTDGDGGSNTWARGEIQWTQNEMYPLLCQQKRFGGIGKVYKKKRKEIEICEKTGRPKSGHEYSIRTLEDKKVFLEIARSLPIPIHRRDQKWKLWRMEQPGFDYSILSKTKDRLPRIRLLFHAREKLGFQFPTQIHEILHEFYPLELRYRPRKYMEELTVFLTNYSKVSIFTISLVL